MSIVILVAIFLLICWMLHVALRDTTSRRGRARRGHTTSYVSFGPSTPVVASRDHTEDDDHVDDDPPRTADAGHDDAEYHVEAPEPSACHGHDSDTDRDAASGSDSTSDDVSCDSGDSDWAFDDD